MFDIVRVVPRISPDGLPTLHPSEYGTTSRRPADIPEPSQSLISEDNESASVSKKRTVSGVG